MHVSISGEAQSTPLLLLHGGGVAGWMWEPTRRYLADDRRLLVPDLPGHGRSADQGYVSHEATISELAALIRETAPGAIVVGFSLGAQLAVLLAAEHPSLVSGAVVVSGEAKPAPLQSLTLALLKWTAPLARQEWFARLQAKQLAVPGPLVDAYVRGSREMESRTLLASVAENIRFALPDAWASFAGSVSVLVGEKERALMRDSARLIHEANSGSTLLVVPASAHDIPFTAPGLLADTIRTAAASARR